MGKTIFADFNKKSWKSTKERINSKFQKGKEWVIKNKEMIILLTPVVIGAATMLIRVVGKNINLHKEESNKTKYCYDPSLGHYWSLKRKLTGKEWLEIDRRRSNGERLSEILESLKVLK